MQQNVLSQHYKYKSDTTVILTNINSPSRVAIDRKRIKEDTSGDAYEMGVKYKRFVGPVVALLQVGM